jgi:hypothetical protein
MTKVGASERESVERESVERESVERESVERESVERESVEREIVEREIVERQIVERQSVERQSVGTPSRSTLPTLHATKAGQCRGLRAEGSAYARSLHQRFRTAPRGSSGASATD